MAGFVKVNGKAASGQFVSRDLWFKNFSLGAAMTQEQLDNLVYAVQLTSTIEVIGDFEVGVSTGVNMVISGADVTVVDGYTVTDVAGF